MFFLFTMFDETKQDFVAKDKKELSTNVDDYVGRQELSSTRVDEYSRTRK